jgi:MFS family permease
MGTIRMTEAPRPGQLLGLPRTYWLLWAGMFINRLGGGVFAFLSVYLTRARGFSAPSAGLVLACYASGGLLAAPTGGLLADRVGRRSTLVGGTALAATAMLTLGAARALPSVAVAAALVGFFTDCCRPALHAAVADVVPPADRRRAYGLLYWALNLGFAGAATLAGVLAERRFGLLFVVDAATTLLFGAVVLLGVPETRPAPDAAGAPPLSLPFRDRAFVSFAVIQLVVLLVFCQLFVAFPLDMSRHGLGAGTIGRVIAVNGLVIVVLQPVALRLTAATPHHLLLAAGAVLTGLGFGVCALAGGVGVFVTASVVMTVGEIAFAIATPAFVANLAPPAVRGGYLGANQLVWSLAGVIAPGLGATVLGRCGGRTLWVGCAAAGLVAAALHVGVTGRHARIHPTDAGLPR